MKSKNLIISPTGKESYVKEWVKGNVDFDLVLLCYDNDENICKDFIKYTPLVYMGKGEKYQLIKSFIVDNIDFISNYDYVWLPDDDVNISTDDINKLFKTAKNFDLWLCQPSMNGYVSHEITKPVKNSVLRYTNFVEVLAPLFNIDVLLKLYETFDLNYSSWGYDYLWPFLLSYPEDKIAIIDNIIMTHVRPIGQNYSRFPKDPGIEMNELLNKYNINNKQIIYGYANSNPSFPS
jgi:hypothetical protein